jgi:hypothetical protein
MTWTEITTANNGGDAVIFYLLEWDQGSDSWTSLNSYTVGMTIPTAYTHNPASILASGGTYKYRLSAMNGVGYSSPAITTITADAYPKACNAPIITDANIKPQEVAITWTAIDVADIGSDPVIFYLLEWDQGSDTWTPLNTYTVGMAVPLSYTHTPATILTTGGTFKYRLTP